MIVTANGAAFDVILSGDGPDLVLFHSLLINRTAFDGIVPALARRRWCPIFLTPAVHAD